MTVTSTSASTSASKPLMSLGVGEAPSLDYSLPQSTSLTANAKIPAAIPTGWFLPAYNNPGPTWWDVERDLDDVRDQLEGAATGSLIPNVVGMDLVDVLTSRVDAFAMTNSSTGGPSSGSGPVVGGPVTTGTVGSGAARPGRTSTASSRPRRGRPPHSAQRGARVTGSSRVVDPNLDAIATSIVHGLMPAAIPTLGGDPLIIFIPPPFMAPRFYWVEEYKVESYLGQYGAGKTLSAFSLLPDEETEITVRTFEQNEATATSAQNVLDSFSQSSADELEHELSVETGQTTTTSESESYDTHSEYDMSLVLNPLDLVNIGGSSHSEIDSDTDSSTVREDNTSSLDRALSKHVAESSYSREIEISSTTESTSLTEEEQTTVRRIRNINHSRVLNFIWRQLLQQYETITYLNNVKVVFTTGDPTSTRQIELCELDDVLPTLIDAEHVDEVKARLLAPYLAVFNHRSELMPFVEKVTRTFPATEFAPKHEVVYYRKNVKLIDAHEGLKVNGVITGVNSFVLPTAATIVEALLSEGEALDAYNRDLQAATVAKAELDNRRVDTALDIIDALDDAEAKVQAYARMFVTNDSHPPHPPTPSPEE